jgi:hypothetical protein
MTSLRRGGGGGGGRIDAVATRTKQMQNYHVELQICDPIMFAETIDEYTKKNEEHKINFSMEVSK